MREVLFSAAGAVVLVVSSSALALLLRWWAWWSGWSPTRPRRVVLAAWLAGGLAWSLAGWPIGKALALAETGRWWPALVTMLPLVIPLGLTQGALLWARRWTKARNGEIASPRKAGQWAHRQFRHAMRRVRREARRPGLVPMLDRRDNPVLGRAAIQTEGVVARLVPADPRLMILPYESMNRHLVMVGGPGSGKTVALLRMMRAWLEAAWLRHVIGAGERPLLIFVDCKGGSDGQATAAKFCAMGTAMGLARGRAAKFPDEVRLDLWSLPPMRLVEVLVAMVKADHPFFADMQDELVALAVLAPCGPPVSSVDFVRRLNSKWLLDAYGSQFPGERESIRENGKHFAGIAARYRGLFRRIGQAVDSGRHLDDFDALCVTLEGTANAVTAGAQAQAVVELVTDLAARGGPDGGKRRVLLVIDEFSAVADRVQVSMLMERSRSLGVSVVVAGQSWIGLGPTEDERKRLLSAAAGGVVLLGTPTPEELAMSGGTGVAVETGTKRLQDGGWGDEGTGRAQRAMVVDPDWVRSLARNPGGAVYVVNGVATWGQVAPVELADRAPGIAAGRLRRAIEQRRTAVVTRGPRLALAELTAGLDELGGDLDDVQVRGEDSDPLSDWR